MTKTLRNIFIKDIGWKLFSLIAALLLWFIATYSEDPTEQATVTTDIRLISVDTLREYGLTLLSPSVERPGQVTITVSGKRSDIGKLDGRMSGLSAYVDFKRVSASYADRAGTPFPLQVDVELPSAYTHISTTPKDLSVIIDMLDMRTLEPEVAVTGEPKSGYQAMPYSCSPGSIDIEGPESVVSTIKSVSLTSVSIANASQDVQTQKKPVVYDENNQDITGKLTLSADEVTVTVPIDPVKRVRVRAVLNVNPARGHRIAGEVTYEPDTVEIVGRQSELDKVSEIVLGTIVAPSAAGDVTETFDIRDFFAQYNYELYVRDGTPYEVTATVPIAEEATKELIIPTNRINAVNLASDAYQADFTGPVYVTVRGMSADLLGLSGLSSLYTARIDLFGLEPGRHSVSVDFKWPDGVIETIPVRIDVTIIDKNAEASGEEDVAAAEDEGGGDAELSASPVQFQLY